MDKTVYVHVNRASKLVDTYISNTMITISCDGRIKLVKNEGSVVKILVECGQDEFMTVSVHEYGENDD